MLVLSLDAPLHDLPILQRRLYIPLMWLGIVRAFESDWAVGGAREYARRVASNGRACRDCLAQRLFRLEVL